MNLPIELLTERPDDGPLADSLIARAFGPGRYAKAAERLREGAAPLRALSFLAWRDGQAIGCVRLWPVAIGETPALLLGPFAVETAERSTGIGAALIRRACDAAAQAGHRLVLLVGDEAYFGPLGFSAAATRHVRMPGPVDQGRVLVRALAPGADEGLTGPVVVAAETAPASEPLAAAAA